jgi:hypothetical protein
MTTRRSLLAAMVALSATACSAHPDASFIEQIQDAVARTCGFVPFIRMIVAIIGLHDPGLQTVQQIVDAICQSLAGVEPARRKGIGPTGGSVHGVPVEGEYVQRF